jgi:hypothetical protein
MVVAAVLHTINGYVVAPRPPNLQDTSLKVPPYQTLPISEEDEATQSTSILLKASAPLSPRADAVLNPLETWCLTHLDSWYSTSQSYKCPFMRRRSGDILDTLETIIKYIIIRKECWQLMGCPQAHRSAGTNKKTNRIKYKGCTLSQICDHILQDWKPGTDGKGYYITGKLTIPLYRDDCLFLGPDPDMPIHGLRKYVGVASHLFDYDTSRAILEELTMIPKDKDKHDSVIAKWTMSGTLRLPWRPSLPTFSGTTTYHIDEEGLIYCHEESWDCSVIRAFTHTLLPELAERIWKTAKH